MGGIVTSIIVGIVIYRKQRKADNDINKVILNQKEILDEFHNRVKLRKKYIILRMNEYLGMMRQDYVTLKEYVDKFGNDQSQQNFERLIQYANAAKADYESFRNSINSDFIEIKEYINNPMLADKFEIRLGWIGTQFYRCSNEHTSYSDNNLHLVRFGINDAIKKIDSLIADLSEEIKEV